MFFTTLVRLAGLEPVRVTPLEPKSSASTNFATSALMLWEKILMDGL